jgi:soluble lytic murein transglycosylase
MWHCLAQITPVRWFRSLLILVAAAALPAQSLDAIAHAYREHPTPQTRAALTSYASTHADSRALVSLVLGATAIDNGQFSDALALLQEPGKALPLIADYPAYLSAVALYEIRQYPDVERSLHRVWDRSPASPLRSKSVLLAANAFLRDGKPKRAITLVQQHLADLTPQQSEMLLAHAYDAAGEPASAAEHFGRLFVDYPQAGDVEGSLARLRSPTPQARLVRCMNLIGASDYARARTELQALIPQLAGPAQDRARVKYGVAQYLSKAYAPAAQYLRPLQVQSPEADAERLYTLLQCARKLDQPADFSGILTQLARSHPRSLWRLQTLLSAGDYHFFYNNSAAYEPIYRACYNSFPSDPLSADCHWRLAFTEYLHRRAEARALLQSFVQRHPNAEKASSALYFLGRLAEGRSEWASAKAYYSAVTANYPNYYYALLARERLDAPNLPGSTLRGASASSEAGHFLAGIVFPPRQAPNFQPSPATSVRLRRARLLASAGLDDLAASELRFGAKTDGQPHLIGLELAELADRQNAPERAIRYIKQFAPNYLLFDKESAPEKFWKLAFPLPFRDSLERYSREHGLDPFVVAALIRQESEFNSKVVSRAHAYGLTQVLPITGRELSRRLNIRPFRPDMLFTPDINLNIGTYFLRSLLDRLKGRWEATLASYNAGPSRVVRWLTWGDFREQAEFVEIIPFDETRTYVQSVLRNADIYRRLYGPQQVAAKTTP